MEQCQEVSPWRGSCLDQFWKTEKGSDDVITFSDDVITFSDSRSRGCDAEVDATTPTFDRKRRLSEKVRRLSNHAKLSQKSESAPAPSRGTRSRRRAIRTRCRDGSREVRPVLHDHRGKAIKGNNSIEQNSPQPFSMVLIGLSGRSRGPRGQRPRVRE